MKSKICGSYVINIVGSSLFFLLLLVVCMYRRQSNDIDVKAMIKETERQVLKVSTSPSIDIEYFPNSCADARWLRRKLHPRITNEANINPLSRTHYLTFGYRLHKLETKEDNMV